MFRKAPTSQKLTHLPYIGNKTCCYCHWTLGVSNLTWTWRKEGWRWRRRLQEGAQFTFHCEGANKASLREGILQFWKRVLSWATNHSPGHGRIELHFLSLWLALLFLPKCHSCECPSGKKQQVAVWGCLGVLGRVVVVGGRRRAHMPLSWTFFATCRLSFNGIWTRTWGLCASSPPALGTSHLNAWQPGSGSLARCPLWPFTFVALRAVCCESSHWATRCLQKRPMLSGSYCLFQPKLQRKEGIVLRETHHPLPTSPWQLI